MGKDVLHVTIVHQRNDIRIFYKECYSLSKNKNYKVDFLVADGNEYENKCGIDIFDLGSVYSNRIKRIFFGNINVFRFIKNSKYKIIHFHDPELLLIALLIRMQGRKVVFDMHENLPKQILTKEYISPIFKKPISFLVKLFQNFNFRFIAVIFAENSYPKDFWKIKKSAVVLNYPILDNLLKINLKSSAVFKVGYLGLCCEERGTLKLLDAIKQLRKENYQMEIKFVGPVTSDVTDTDIYRQSINEGWAEFTGRLDPNEAWLAISECTVGAAVLLPSPNFVESYPTKLFEYMALGIPTLVSDFPLYREVVNKSESGVLVNPDSIDDIQKTLVYFFENPDVLESMGKKGKEYVVNNYNWETENKKLQNLYESL